VARVLITGSADGLGQLAAELLLDQGHKVTLHARSDERAAAAHAAVPRAAAVVVGDLASIAEVRVLAQAANELGDFDAVIHNAAVGYREPRIETVDGLEHVFAINVLAPYLLTALMARPRRLVYLGSGMHRSGDPDTGDLQWAARPWNGSQAYADSKLWDVVLAFAIAALAGGGLERGRAWLGGDEDGWARRARRPRARRGHAGVARRLG